ncbi:Protein Hook 3 [Vanrija pseudolonga]|uniref:Protein Hook 3 n=1 Tax=Vanrija pseudolonga TaxID=143232 RepID=A0AAF1BHM3_9TREE|nr:Protein Hook 3 [Vanrija pseudolonga]
MSLSQRREQDALLALFNSFRPSRRVVSFEQLADGKVLMEVMHQIDGAHFKGHGPKVHHRSSGSGAQSDNWVLRMNLLKRLYRLLLSYPINSPTAPTLAVTSLPEPPFNTIARSPKCPEGSAGLLQICRVCVAVGSMGPANERVIAKIQALDESSMVEIMKTIEGVMATLPKGPEDETSDDRSEIAPISSALREERDRLIQENEDLRAKFEDMTDQVNRLTTNLHESQDEHTRETRKRSLEDTMRNAASPLELENLRADLARAEDGLAETEAALEKQTALVAELTSTVEELRSATVEVAKLRDQIDEYRHVEDRLHKSENVIEKFKKKLEDSAGLRRELRALEAENAELIDKNSTLEGEIRKLGASKALVDNYKAQVDILEKKANEQSSEYAQLAVQLEDAHTALATMEHERDRLIDEIQVHQERIKELEHGPRRVASMMIDAGNTSLDVELDVEDDESAGLSKTELRLKIRALEREIAEIKVPLDNTDKITALETLLADSNKARERYQNDYLEATRQTLLAQAKLDHIMTGRAGNDQQTALALRQQLDEVLEDRNNLVKDKQAADVAHEELVRQLTAAKADLGLVDKDKRNIIASARDEANTDSAKFSEQVVALKDELSTLKERDRLHLEEIRRLMMDKIELQSAGNERTQEALEREQRLNDLRASLEAGGVSPMVQHEVLELRQRNDTLTTEVAKLTDRLKQARAFIKNQDALFRAEHEKRISSDFNEVQKSYESQIATLKNELSIVKHNALSIESLYRLEQQLMLSAWHDLGTRVVRDHVGAAGLRRPVMPRPVMSSWLARQRKHQDDALFTR